MRLNLCCGQDIRNGFLNIDVRRLDPRILQLDLERDLLTPFPPESAEEIVAQDCVEHVSWRRVPDLLRDVYRVLRCGGIFVIRVPDLEEIARFTFLNPGYDDFIQISYWIFGGQDYPENTHKAGFTKPSARRLLEDIGFRVLEVRNEGTNMVVAARKEGQ